MTLKRGKIDCTGKPYSHVGWHNDDRPKFVRKTRAKLEEELSEQGLAPVFDETGWFVGTTKMPVTTIDAEEIKRVGADFAQAIRDAGPILTQTLGADRIIRPHDDMVDATAFALQGKPPEYGKKTLYGNKLYDGPEVDVTVWQDDLSCACEVHIRQKKCLTNKIVRFGPVRTNLKALFRDGHWLETRLEYRHFNPHADRWARVYLTDGTDRYKLYSIGFSELQALGKTHGQYDLGAALADGTNLLRTHSSARYPKPVIQKVEVPVERDPFEVLAERYPRPKKHKPTLDTMVGNSTLRDRLNALI